MSYRDQWKMLHLLNISMRGALKEAELIAVGTGDMKEIYVDVPSCFIVMPFSEEWSNTVFYDFIQPAVIKSKMECVRGDMIPRVGKLSENIAANNYVCSSYHKQQYQQAKKMQLFNCF